MKIFEIRDGSQITSDGTDRLLGFLFCFPGSGRFYIELMEDAGRWEAPALFYGHVKRRQYSVDHEWSLRWVRQRIVPAERQNIASILRDNKLKEYDEYRLLILSMGRCSQDDCYIIKTAEDALPEDIQRRLDQKVRDVMPLSSCRMTVFFRDGTGRIVDIGRLATKENLFRNVLENDEIFQNVRVSPGGFGIEWDKDRFIPAGRLYDAGKASEISYEDVLLYARNRLSDTTGISKTLDVSRQYIDQLVKQGKLHPVMVNRESRMFAKAEIESERSYH